MCMSALIRSRSLIWSIVPPVILNVAARGQASPIMNCTGIHFVPSLPVVTYSTSAAGWVRNPPRFAGALPAVPIAAKPVDRLRGRPGARGSLVRSAKTANALDFLRLI